MATQPTATMMIEEDGSDAGDRRSGRFHMLRAVCGGLGFGVYIVLSILCFWLWLIAAVMNGVRFFALNLAEGLFPPADEIPPLGKEVSVGGGAGFDSGMARRAEHYKVGGEAIARRLQKLTASLVLFSSWSTHRQVAVVVLVFLLVAIPAVYIVPRPHYVTITNSNSLIRNDVWGNRYLILGTGLFNDQPYEYQNRENWLLGKFTNQRIKNRLQVGKHFRLWVTGIRWYVPELYPNIIGIEEVDLSGKPIA